MNGEEAHINNPRDAKKYGIETIYQTLAVADNVDAAANLYLGREILTNYGTLDDAAMESEARKVMGRLNPNFQRFKEPGEQIIGRATPVRRNCASDTVQCAHFNHGRANCCFRPARN